MSAAGAPRGDPWPWLARRCRDWASAQGLALRDVVVLVPFAQLLLPARRAFADAGGWQPRIETTQTLAESLGPSIPSGADALDGRGGVDVLTAARLLRSTGVFDEPGALVAMAETLATTAGAIARAAAARSPRARETYWQEARSPLADSAGPGQRERMLSRLALAWAATAPAALADALLALRPAGWCIVQAGGADPWIDTLAAAAAEAGVPAVLVDADDDLAPPSDLDIERAVCDGFEQQAQQAAATVIDLLARGHAPVAIVALDRSAVRRIRALLERSGVALADETGWTLSTTRAGAIPVLLLRAAAANAGTDALFDWLKSLPGWPERVDAGAGMQRLERTARRERLVRVDALAASAVWTPEERSLLDRILAVLDVVRAPSPRSVADWLGALERALCDCGALDLLRSDAAGRRVLEVLRLDGAAIDAAWRAATSGLNFDPDGFARWLEAMLDRESFVPPAPAEAEAVIVPLARVMLRPFAALVCPGADDRRLGAPPPPHPWLDDGQLARLGLPDATAQRRTEALSLLHALQVPRVVFLRCRAEAQEVLGDSPLLQRLALDLASRGRQWREGVDTRPLRTLAARPIERPAPTAASRVPARITASAAEALRDCPYRFYTRHMLGLQRDEELDDPVEKRDYGSWLHRVLHAFHSQRPAPRDAAADSAALHAIAETERVAMVLDEDRFLPFGDAFRAFVPRYLRWLHARDAEGLAWHGGEIELRLEPPDAGTEFHGVLDRLDRSGGAAAGSMQLLDYKTSSVEELKRRARQPLEDTQLAFYAALAGAHGFAPLRAFYVALDASPDIVAVEHGSVERSAAALVDGLGGELRRLREGAALPALGEARACDYCEARGLCRRDDWWPPDADEEPDGER